MQRLLIFWLALTLLVGPIAPVGLLAAVPSPLTAAAEGGATMVMHAGDSTDAAMAMTAPCEACDPASSGHGDCSAGACEHKGCVHASCSTFLPRPTLYSRGEARRTSLSPAVVVAYHSHLPDLPRRPPIV